MSESESFIEEVTEEVRRDKLFAIFRKYGWIAGVVVVLIVGGAAYNEYRKASEIAAAQALGDNVLNALENPDAASRADALADITPAGDAAALYLDVLQAAARVEAEDAEKALQLLDGVAGDAGAPDIYRQLAQLKAVILRGADQDREARMAVLDALATPGNPFRVLAMEQKAIVLYEFGDNEQAIALLREVLDEPGATQDLLQRAQQLIVALGGALAAPGQE